MTETRYRMVFLALGIALIGVVAFALLLSPDAPAPVLPAAVESVSPPDGATVLRQTDLVIDMSLGYEIEVFVDGLRVPQSEMSVTEAIGLYTWVPGPGRTLEEWSPGLHAITVRYDRVVGGAADVGELRWVFRVQ